MNDAPPAPAIGHPRRFDAIIVGGGHNGLVAGGYLAATGLAVLIVEAAPRVGGPAATVEFMPGYRTSISNSPGSLEPKVVADLELERHGLRFTRPDPTLVHPLPGERLYVGWRDPARNAAQLERFATGEAARYQAFFDYLQNFANRLGISLFGPPPTLPELTRNLTTLADQEAFARIFFGSARDLMDEFCLAPETQALIAPLAVVGGQVAPSSAGTPINLLMRPLSLASMSTATDYDPRRMPLRGSTGLPIGGMGSIVAAMETSFRSRGGVVRIATPIHRILTRDGVVTGVVTAAGEEITAPIVIAATNPRTTIVNFLADAPEWSEFRAKMRRRPMRGRAFKIVLALDGLPRYAGSGEDAVALAAAQFRIAPTLDYLEEAHTDMMLGRLSEKPVIWGLCPSITSPMLAPPGRHLLSLNIGNAPYRLTAGSWSSQRDVFAKRCIETLAGYMPGLCDMITDYRCIDPEQFERDYGLVEANITHGDALPWNMFWMRPLPGLHAYRTPTRGLYLSGNGTWPGNYVSGLAGHNASAAVLTDIRAGVIHAGATA
jgi:phytoene dehydrogenase-like protein